VPGNRRWRFLNLESAGGKPEPAPPGEGEQDGRLSRSRFESIQTGEAAPAAPDARAQAQARFGAPTEQELGLEERDAMAQPFVRCLWCQGDSARFATVCAVCDAPLDTPEQRAFNERLWAERLAHRAQEQQTIEAVERQRAQLQDDEARARREYYELLARQQAEGRNNTWDPSSDPLPWWGRRRSRSRVPLLAWVAMGGVAFLLALAGGPGLVASAFPFILIIGGLAWFFDWLKR
jgi:hypothetical protein